MDHLDPNSSAPLDTNSTPKPSVGSIHQSSQALPQSPASAEESSSHPHGWKTIGGQQGSYDEEGFLYPSCNLTSEKLKDRKEDDVVIFSYSLSRTDEIPLAEGSGPSSGIFSESDDIFFQVPKDTLIESEQFNQVINPEKEPRFIQSRARLAIIDFPQCYDTYDDGLLNSMGEKLGLLREGDTTLMDAYLRRVRTLPGHGRFRTGISLRAPFKKPSGLSQLPKPGSSEDRFILFVSFPYFGGSTKEIPLGPENESVGLLDFKRLGVDVPDRKVVVVSEEERDDIGKILVHQARYMIFDNYTMATFRSKEDSAKDQIPLPCSQERIGAFRAMIHMIANRMNSELWALAKFQAFLCKLEEDIDEVISDANAYEDNQGMERNPDDVPLELRHLLESISPKERELLREDKVYRQVRQEHILNRKRKRVLDLLTSLNRLSASLFAAISVAERQIAVLQELYTLFLTRDQTKTKAREGGYPLRQNPFYRNIAPIPILSENSEQTWPNTLDTIEEVVREKKCFLRKVKGLVENMDIRRKILSAFLKSDQATERTAQEVRVTLKEIKTQIMQQGGAVDWFALLATVFLPLNFCASYFGMQTVKEFGGTTATMSLRQFWRTTAPAVAAILLLTAAIVLWNRSHLIGSRFHWEAMKKEKKLRPLREKIDDLEQSSRATSHPRR
ncbi:hypothetical protein B9Z19DRAFT_966094 [Tuber borchii]|uniref:Uncharacterized protein n=1 Tax=Tuber borchii TaxID=42251 RepID=A0A2T7A5E2_TUBBO|nr:hypothetical protein B9Z19DRAFT_966094 [Tuber borchii]